VLDREAGRIHLVADLQRVTAVGKDGGAPKVIEHEPAPEALGVPLVAISVQDDAE